MKLGAPIISRVSLARRVLCTPVARVIPARKRAGPCGSARGKSTCDRKQGSVSPVLTLPIVFSLLVFPEQALVITSVILKQIEHI